MPAPAGNTIVARSETADVDECCICISDDYPLPDGRLGVCTASADPYQNADELEESDPYMVGDRSEDPSEP